MLRSLRTRPRSPLVPRLLATTLAFAGTAGAQCGQWRIDPADPGGLAGAERIYTSALWDDDGPGPNAARLVVGGDFSRAGGTLAGHLAVYDPDTRQWSRLGGGFNDTVHAVVGMPNGDLIAGGDFFTADGVFFFSIARWDGSSWSPLAGGLDNRVTSLAVLPGGDLVAGGYFSSSSGTSMRGVARWDGTSWSPMGAGFNGIVLTLTVGPGGQLYAGGLFTASGTTPLARVARWDGTAWQPLGAGVSGPVHDIEVLPNGEVVCVGLFASASAGGVTVNSIARWDGANWNALDGGFGGTPALGRGPDIAAVSILDNGDIVATGNFSTAGQVAAERIARWDGTAWHPMGSGLTQASQIAAGGTTSTVLPGGDLFVAGRFTEAGGVVVRDAARWNPSGWQRTNPGIEGRIYGVHELANGDVIAGGSFRTIGGVQTPNVARWDGTSWQPLGNGLGGLTYSDGVNRFAELPSGDIVASGLIYERTSPNSIAPGVSVWRWDGVSWSPLGTGIRGSISGLLSLRDGRVAIGKASELVVWDGSTLQTVGSGSGAQLFGIAECPDGSIVVGGRFSSFGGVAAQNVALWNGSSWSAMGSGVPIDATIECLPGGDVVAYETSPPAAYRWDGQSWTPLNLPAMTVLRSLESLPDGDLVLHAYTFVGPSQPSEDVWRGDGNTWASMVPAGSEYVPAAVLPTRFSGGLWLGGTMVDASGRMAELSRFESLCPATTAPVGSGCPGSGGVPQLRAAVPPWIGSVYRANCTGLPSNGLAIEVFGAATTTALPAILRPSPGCVAHAVPEIVTFQPASQQAILEIEIPLMPALVGTQIVQQVLGVELNGAGRIQQTSASQGLLLTIGTY